MPDALLPLPCPFCGGPPTYYADADSVWCPAPGCPWKEYDDYHGMPLAMWNRRTPAVPPDAIGALREIDALIAYLEPLLSGNAAWVVQPTLLSIRTVRSMIGGGA